MAYANKEQKDAYGLWYRAQPKNREKARLRARQQYAADKASGKLVEVRALYEERLKNDPIRKEQRRLRVRQWARERDRKKRAAVAAQLNTVCTYCGQACTPLIPRWEVGHGQLDHIIPLTRGGPDTIENMQLLCQWCNNAKFNMTHEEFLAYLKRIAKHLKL